MTRNVRAVLNAIIRLYVAQIRVDHIGIISRKLHTALFALSPRGAMLL